MVKRDAPNGIAGYATMPLAIASLVLGAFGAVLSQTSVVGYYICWVLAVPAVGLGLAIIFHPRIKDVRAKVAAWAGLLLGLVPVVHTLVWVLAKLAFDSWDDEVMRP